MLHIYLLYIYIYLGINKGVLIQGIIYLQKSNDLIVFTREISWCQEYSMLCCDNQKYYIYSINIICYAVLIKNNTYIPWNVLHWSLLYICVGIIKDVLI